VVKEAMDVLKKTALDMEGLFRIPGRAEEIQHYRISVDSGKENIKMSELSPHSIASLLKLYIRELPSPLCTTELYPAFLAVES